MNTKKWYQSWTVWINIILLAIDFVNSLTQFVPIPAGVIAEITAVGNILLRFKTTTGIRVL